MPSRKDKKYLQWIRNQPCLITHSNFEIVAHHITVNAQRGIGLKPSDYWAVPLKSSLHVELHNMGERRFWAKYAVLSPHYLACLLLMQYLGQNMSDEDMPGLLRHIDSFAGMQFGDK